MHSTVKAVISDVNVKPKLKKYSQSVLMTKPCAGWRLAVYEGCSSTPRDSIRVSGIAA